LQMGDLTEDARIRLDRELREMRRNVNRQKEDLLDELSFRRTEEVQKLEDQINQAVEEIARNNGYDHRCILPSLSWISSDWSMRRINGNGHCAKAHSGFPR